MCAVHEDKINKLLKLEPGGTLNKSHSLGREPYLLLFLQNQIDGLVVS